MNEELVQFDRNPLNFYLFLAAGVMWLLSLTMNLLVGDLGLAALNALTAALFIAAGLLQRKPYIRLTNQVLSVNIAPIRPFTDIPWTAIQRANRRTKNLVEIYTVDGKMVKLYINAMPSAQRPVLVSALEQRLGPLSVAS